MPRCDGLQIRRLHLVGCSSSGILGCDSISGVSIRVSVFGCLRGFDLSLATASHAGHGAGDAFSVVGRKWKRFPRICVPSVVAKMYERGAWCCLTTTASVHSRTRFIRTGSPSCSLESGRVPRS